MTDYKQHPLSAAFPAMSDAAFGELRADIAAHGLHAPIVTYDGQVLDGWHRYQACQQTGTEPRYTAFDGDEAAAMAFVVSTNLMRRHLDTSQRGLIGGRLATLAHGANQHSGSNGGGGRKSAILTVDEAAVLVNVSKDVIKDARVVLAGATPEVIAKVRSGEVSVSKAAKDVRASRPKAALKPKPDPVPTLVPQVEIAPQTVPQWAKLSAVARHAHLARGRPRQGLLSITRLWVRPAFGQ